MIQLEMLVEEPSADDVLRHPLPKLLRGRARAKVVNLGSKYNLLKMLRDRLAAYRIRIDQDGGLGASWSWWTKMRGRSVFGEPACPTIESNAAHLLYFVIKNPPLRRRQQAHRFLHAG